MARKRERIYPRTTGGGQVRYDVSLDYKDPHTGRRVQKMRTFRTLKEAKDALAEHRAETASGQVAPPENLTIAQLLEEWLTGHRPHLRPTTYDHYRATIDHHVLPHLGATKLSDLSARVLERHYSTLAAHGLGQRAVQNVHQRLVQALNYARRRHLVRGNVAQDATPPPVAHREMQVWNDAEMGRFLAVADQSRYGPVWYVALSTGLRRGELLGLRWEDVNEEDEVLHVREALAYHHGHLITHQTKTGRARKVSVPPELLALLRLHRVRQLQWRLAAGAAWTDSGRVFTNSRGGPIDPTCLRDDLNILCERAKVRRLRVHDLRHTHASWLIRYGRTVREVSDRLGHARSSITMDVYAHAIPDQHRETAALVGRLFQAR